MSEVRAAETAGLWQCLTCLLAQDFVKNLPCIDPLLRKFTATGIMPWSEAPEDVALWGIMSDKILVESAHSPNLSGQ